MPRKDLKSLLFVPHAVSRVASQLLFRELDLYFGNICGGDEDVNSWNQTSSSDRSCADIEVICAYA